MEGLWPLLSIVTVTLILVLLKGRKGETYEAQGGGIMMVTTLLLFILSGLFLANTIMNPVESLSYQVGEALCFAADPTLLISGIIICVTIPHEKKEKHVTVEQTPAAPS